MSSRPERITFEERQIFEEKLNQKIPVNKIADLLGKCRSTLFRERKRCDGAYNAKEAQATTVKGFSPIDFTIIGKKFGMLTIVEYVATKDTRTWWLAKCECGQETRISRKTLGDKHSKKYPFNCGCLGKQKCHQRIREEEISLLSRYNCLMKMIEKEHDCWIWTGYINKSSQVPMTSWNNRVWPVRRLLYKILNPSESGLPDFMYASCGDRTCVNPDHIVIGRPPKGHYLN